MSPLQKLRTQSPHLLPQIFQNLASLKVASSQEVDVKENALQNLFPHTFSQKLLTFEKGDIIDHKPLIVGVVFSGGQAPGGHNVIAGLFDALKKLHPDSRLIGFLNGPKGIIDCTSMEITEGMLVNYRNQGGFDLIGSGRDKIESMDQLQKTAQTVLDLQLNGLVVIGGDDSNTNAAVFAEYFLSRSMQCSVIGVPKTIDGDLRNKYIEVSFGFDTACKIYSEIIGNIARDAISAKKYYYFIKLMGRSASHVTLECALQTHPNMTLIGEEIESESKTLKQIVGEICDLICERASLGKNYGVILIPEGIIEFIPEFKQLIKELNHLIAEGSQPNSEIELHLTEPSKHCFSQLPEEIRSSLLLDRDPHGNIQISKIETEKLFIDVVTKELKARKDAGTYIGKFNSQPQFCGYEGRSGMPSCFDSNYCYSLGHVAALLVDAKVTGYMCSVRNLHHPLEKWDIAAVPLISLMHFEDRHGKRKPVIAKALVNLKDPAFQIFKKFRQQWALQDDYPSPGPIQFFGPKEITDCLTISLSVSSMYKGE